MSYTLYFHPLASFCQKVLVGLYELGVPFTKRLVDLSNAEDRAELVKLWPMAKFPVLRDDARDVTVVESSLVLEYVDDGRLLPCDPDRAREVRARDRFFDLYVAGPMDRIVANRLRPAASRDPFGVEEARARLEQAYGIAEQWLREGALGGDFSLADCAAAPALSYANRVHPFGAGHRRLTAYCASLAERPSFARVQAEAAPYRSLFPE